MVQCIASRGAHWVVLALTMVLLSGGYAYAQEKRAVPGPKELPYSEVIVVGNTPYIAEQGGTDESGKVKPGGIGPMSGASKLKMPGPEVQNLMLGTWAIKAEYASSKVMPNGGVGEGIEVWRPGPGGYSVIEEYHEKNANREIDGFGAGWWDADLQGQRFVWCDNTNPRGCTLSRNVAKWQGNRLVYREDREENGKKITHQEIFEDITPSSFSQVLSEGPAGSELKRIVTIHASKVLGASMTPAQLSPADAELRAAKAEGREAGKSSPRCVVDSAPQSPDEAELVRIERDWCDATIDRDAKKLDRIFAEDISWIEDVG